MKYAKLENGILEYAPSTFDIDGGVVTNPTHQMYIKRGWKPVCGNPAKPPRSDRQGMHLVFNGWRQTDTQIMPVWKLVKDIESEPAPRIFSKMKFVAMMMQIDAWEQVKQWIVDNGMYDLYLAAQEFAEDNKQFDDAKKAVQQLLQLSDLEVEDILSNCVKD